MTLDFLINSVGAYFQALSFVPFAIFGPLVYSVLALLNG